MTDWRIDVLGDRALVVNVLDAAPLTANARVHQVADALRDARLRGVRDVVPGMHDLVVHVDPLRCDVDAVETVVRRAMATDVTPPGDAAVVHVPVTYGGAAGPDLEDVAAACGLGPDDVCRRHAATEYVVCFVGFLPGFPYLGLLDPSLRLPRRTTPRAQVPPGSVAIAGEYTGIYPWASPGGWHLIGRTDVAMFDPGARQPARFMPGMRVRFVAD